MGWSSERATLESYVQQTFTGAPVQYQGVPFTVPNSTWVRMQIRPSTTKRISLGPSGVFRETSLLVFEIYTPANQGSDPARVIADQLGALFLELQLVSSDTEHMTFQVPTLDDLGPTQDQNWYHVNVTVEYRRDFTN